jgi:hypothetical protein
MSTEFHVFLDLLSISRSRLTLSYHVSGHSDSDRHGVLASPRSSSSLLDCDESPWLYAYRVLWMHLASPH